MEMNRRRKKNNCNSITSWWPSVYRRRANAPTSNVLSRISFSNIFELRIENKTINKFSWYRKRKRNKKFGCICSRLPSVGLLKWLSSVDDIYLTPFQQATETELMHTRVGEAFTFHTAQTYGAIGWRWLIIILSLFIAAGGTIVVIQILLSGSRCIGDVGCIAASWRTPLLRFQKLPNPYIWRRWEFGLAIVRRWTFG